MWNNLREKGFRKKNSQAVAKVCAAWNLYEHSNGFRAKNF